MKTVAPHDRPREKLARLGAAALGDNELLAIVLGQGRAARARSIWPTRCLRGRRPRRSRARGHDELRGSPDRPGARGADARRRRAGAPHASRTRPASSAQMTSPRAVAEFLLPQYGNRPVEQFGVVLLDTKHRVLRTTVLRRHARRQHRPSARGFPRGGGGAARPRSCCSTIIRRAIRSRAARIAS